MSTTDISIGIDLGGTNLRAAVFRGLAETAPTRDGGEQIRPVYEEREQVGDSRDPQSIVGRIAEMVPDLLRKAELGGLHIPVGIGFAGMLRGHEGDVANAPNLGWRDVPFGRLLQEKLGERYRVGIYNDVNAITYGEYALGAGAGATDVLAVFVGTGIGSGAVVDGRLLEGFNNTASELGHTKIIFDDTALECKCGLKGCVEAYVGGSRLQARARAELGTGKIRSRALSLAGSAKEVNPGHLDAAAAEGDEYALGLFAEVAPMLGVAMANAVTLFNPERLILGGGMFSRTPVLQEHVIAAFQVAVNPPAAEGLEICSATLGEYAGPIGAALLAGLSPR